MKKIILVGMVLFSGVAVSAEVPDSADAVLERMSSIALKAQTVVQQDTNYQDAMQKATYAAPAEQSGWAGGVAGGINENAGAIVQSGTDKETVRDNAHNAAGAERERIAAADAAAEAKQALKEQSLMTQGIAGATSAFIAGAKNIPPPVVNVYVTAPAP